MSKSSVHIGSDLLLAQLDGELSRRDSVRVAAHLESCWPCRVRLAEIEQTIADVVRHRDRVAARVLPPQPGPRAQFIARLNAQAESRPARRKLPLWPAWVAAAAMLALVVLHWLTRVPAVSAADLLQRAARSEAAALAGLARPVVRQTVEIRAGNRKIRRTIYRDTATRRTASPGQAPADAALERAFLLAGVPWDNPLSASAYDAWRTRQHIAEERTSPARLPGGADGVALTTATRGAAAVSEASLVVRVADWHPVRRTFRLRDGGDAGDFECTELAFSIVPIERVEPGVFADPASAVAAPSAPAPLSAPVATAVEVPLERLVDALYRLHLAGACLGEGIEVTEERDCLRITGRVDDERRRIEILDAVSGLSGVRADIRAFDEGAGAGGGTATTLVIEGEAAPAGRALRTYLERTLPARDAAKTAAKLSDEAVDMSRAMVQHAWSLRRLAERFRPDQVAALPERSRLELERMVSDHRQEVSRRVTAESKLLAPLFEAFSAIDPAVAAWEPPRPSWPGNALDLFAEVEAIDRGHWRLFAGPEAAGAELTALSRDLHARLEGLRRHFAAHGTEIRLDHTR